MTASKCPSSALPPPTTVEGEQPDYWDEVQKREVQRAQSQMDEAPPPATDPDE